LRAQCSTICLSRSITVAEGVFAPGHLGELTQQVPFELADAVLAETGTVQQRLRDLPSRIGLYFVLALGLYAHLGYARVWDKLVAGLKDLPGLAVAAPSEKALRDLRRRIGPAPVKALFEILSGPLAPPHTPGVRYRRWRTVAFDGCSSLKAPDTNRVWLGKIKYRMGLAGYPMVMLMGLVETGTRGLLGAVFGPTGTGETTYAQQLTGLLDEGMLVLADRGFDGNAFLRAVAGAKAQLLVRAKSTRRPPVLAVLPDGSWLTRIAGLQLRVIDAVITVTGTDGSVVTGTYRLFTTLLDHRTDPAARLVQLYHERWEIESAYYSLRHTLLGGRVLRSNDRSGLEQELWGLLATYQVLRMAITDAARAGGLDPDRASFTIALEAARDTLTTATGILPGQIGGRIDLIGVIGRAVLAHPLPARRARYSARKVKSPISRYHARPADDDRPLVTTSIDTVTTQIHEPVAAQRIGEEPATATPSAPASSPAGRPRRSPPRRAPRPPAPSPAAATAPGADTKGTDDPSPRPPTADEILDLLRSDPYRPWHGRDIAQILHVTNINSLRTRMSQWAHKGLLHKIGRATYTLAPA
jgi:Insertion element 4 transposase N-terminal/Transposase DDE domain